MGRHAGGLSSPTMLADGDGQARVWCDAQRLGILLQVLFIEVMREPRLRDSSTTLRALVQAGGDKLMRVCIAWQAAQEFGIEGGTGGEPVPDGALPLGMLLCKNIATEMGGRLQVMRDAAGMACFELELPEGDALQGSLCRVRSPPWTERLSVVLGFACRHERSCFAARRIGRWETLGHSLRERRPC